MADLTDAELLKRYVSDNAETAFTALVARHVAVVYGAAFRQLGNPALAEDVTQEVFVTLARKAVWLTGHSSLVGWLYRTAVHLAQHEARAAQRRHQREQIAIELGTTMKPDESLLADLLPVLDEALLELRAADRDALVLRFFARKSLREVGNALGVREDAAQKRVAKGVDALTESFRRRGFRVAGTAAVALLLQQASAGAVPAGLAALASKAALSAGTAASLGSLTLPIVKIMSLTKTQTTALCVALAVMPLGYEWHALISAERTRDQLNQQLKTLRADTVAREREQVRAERRFTELERRLASTRANATPAVASSAVNDKDLYLWDENSPYVRVPKQILSQVRFAPFDTRVARDGKTERYQLPPLASDGTPQPALEAALGLSVEEAQQFREICQATFGAFHKLIADHSELKEGPFANAGKSIEMNTVAFKADGAQMRDQFQTQLAALLGPERMEAFWQQATSVFRDSLNDFGAYKRNLKLVSSGPTGPLSLFDHYRNEGRARELTQLNGRPLPPSLQAYADAWQKEIDSASLQPKQP